ncbi:putative Cytochrome [Forsythia ovata]|uniref:Cytochrome n=1 Tax=Forsythia ovata TaxID=205694 RepID=A0ABD1X714_9LAMI
MIEVDRIQIEVDQGPDSFRGRPMWGTVWVWDARLTYAFISFLIYLGTLCFQKLSVELALISIRAGPIDIPIIKSSVNWWNTSHQPGSISRSGTSIHVVGHSSRPRNLLHISAAGFDTRIRSKFYFSVPPNVKESSFQVGHFAQDIA